MVDEVDNPYRHSKSAQDYEKNRDMRRAEEAYKAAVRAADTLPLAEYKSHFQSKTAHEVAESDLSIAGKQAAFTDIEAAYQELLALPFLTRVQLAGFYARHGAVPEARDTCEEALKLGLDECARGNRANDRMFERARELLTNLTDIIGPRDVETLFEANFDKLDADHDRYISEDELKRAQLDLSIDAEAQKLIRYMLYHFLDIETASKDELFNLGVDMKGITRKDMKEFQKQANANWKRMRNEQ